MRSPTLNPQPAQSHHTAAELSKKKAGLWPKTTNASGKSCCHRHNPTSRPGDGGVNPLVVIAMHGQGEEILIAFIIRVSRRKTNACNIYPCHRLE